MGALIWLASYPKSGNTWTRAFLHNLLKNPDKPADINQLNQFCLGEDRAELYRQFTDRPLTELTPAEVSAIRPKVHELLTHSFPDSVFVKTHNYFGEWEGHPMVNMDVTAGAIYLVRNPLDVAVSYSHHFGRTLDETVEEMGSMAIGTPTTDVAVRQVYSSWSMNVKSWTEQNVPNIHVARYEDMVNQPLKTFGAMARFLGLNPPRERLQKAIRFSSFKVLQNQEREHGFVERTVASKFFREGKIGQWKKRLSQQQIEKIVADHREQMERFGYVPRGL
jgi:hypothetical protein